MSAISKGDLRNIAVVGHKGAGSVTHTLTTFTSWKPKLLRNGSYFALAFDTDNNAADFERCAFAFYQGGLRGQLSNCGRRKVGKVDVRKTGPKSVEFTVPWHSGMTGIVVRTDLAPDIDSVADLYDPKYKGHVTMLTEMRDTVPMTLKSMGIDPETADTDEWLAAVDKIEAAADSGQIRKFTGNDYIRELASGDAWASLGWSGDAVQLQKDNPNIEFVMPEEGCMLWSTSLEIPVGAPNPEAAQALINYVYDPKVQADIAEWVNYVTPVAGVKRIVRKRDPELARNQLIFPSKSYTADCTFEPVLGGAMGDEVTEAFQRVITG